MLTKLGRAFASLRQFARLVVAKFDWRQPKRVSRHGLKFSAYLSIYNDWDLLEVALKSIADHVDELIVVDGAYEWMAPYLVATGTEPSRSDERVYDIIRDSGIPFRCINRTWGNELEKRRAGYEACAHRFVFRIDADEVLFFNEDALEEFLASGRAVAAMHMPNYVAPGWLLKPTRLRDRFRKFPSQSVLFDAEKISAAAHLKYLWLVIPADSLPQSDRRTFATFEKPIAFCAHLTDWRTSSTAVNRNAFYAMNWMRKFGVPWLPDLSGKPLDNFGDFLNRVPARQFKQALKRGAIPMGKMALGAHETLVRSPLSANDEKSFLGTYLAFLDGLVDQNHEAATEFQTLIFGDGVFFDLSSERARQALSADGTVTISTSVQLAEVKVTLHTLATTAPMSGKSHIIPTIRGNSVQFELPEFNGTKGVLRQVLEFRGWAGGAGALCLFRVDDECFANGAV